MILIAVALFAALSYAVANMMRTGGGEQQIGEQKAGLLADEVMAYGRRLRQVAQSLEISSGCDEAQISFEAAGLTGYDHTPAADPRCGLFHENGGGLAYIKPSTDFGAVTDWVFTGGLNVQGVGTDCASGDSCTELLAVLSGLDLPVCEAINAKLGIVTPDGAPPVQDGVIAFDKFTGDLTYTATVTDQAGTDVLKGQQAGCSRPSDSDAYFFYQTLAGR